MSIAEKTKRYYSWIEVWRSKDAARSKSLELAFYKINIAAKMEKKEDEWVIKVPWVYKEVADTAVHAYLEHKFEYPSEIQINERWESYNRFQPARFKGRGSKMILMIGLALFLLLVVRIIYGLRLFG